MKHFNSIIAAARLCKSVLWLTVLTLSAFGGGTSTCFAQPTMVWAKSMGGSTSFDYGASIAVDASGNVYTTGSFQGTVDFDPSGVTYNLTSVSTSSSGQTDIFVSKLDASGNFAWAKQLSGSSDESGNSIAVDGSGNVYTTGTFKGTVDFNPDGVATANLTSPGFFETDAFVSKLDASGNFVWAIQIGGSGYDGASSITVDAGNVYVTGTYALNQIFVSKLNAAGTVLWTKYTSGAKASANSISVDAGGNVYTTGYFGTSSGGITDFDPDAVATFNLTSAGQEDIFVSKLDASGNFVWAKQIGGANSDKGRSIAVDASANVYTTGYFESTVDFNPDAVATFNLTAVGTSFEGDIYISKLDASGNFAGAISIDVASGTTATEPSSIALDPSSGNVYIMGDQYPATVDYDPVGTFNVSNTGMEANFIAEYNSSLGFICAMAISPGHNETTNNRHLAVSANNVWVTGSFNLATTDFNPCGSFSPVAYGNNDIFVAKYDFSACNCAPLPISLLSFTASCHSERSEESKIVLQWQTATETNNDYFTIERAAPSNSPKGGGLNWEVAGTVKGAGNSSSTLNYEFIDNSPSLREGRDGLLYYRLSQTDFDGKTETFNSKQIAVDVTECAVKVFPNPAGNTLNIPYTAEQDGEITLQVYDVIGQLVKDKVVAAVKGHNKFTLDLTTVAQGMYVLKVKGGVKEQNQKFVRE